MDLNLIWKAVLIVLAGTILLRFAGRKSISQMTLPQTVIMIGIGSLLIQPVSGKNIWETIVIGLILVLTLIVIEYAQIKSNGIEKIITGQSKILIENGIIQDENLRKLRLTVDQLEMNLRQKNVSKISDVQFATLEPNGQVGYELKQQAKPVTKQEFQLLQQDIQQILLLINASKIEHQPLQTNRQQTQTNQGNIFHEVDEKSHNKRSPNFLQ